MRAYIGFDDTDAIDSEMGTGKLARLFENDLPDACRQWGAVRQQLLVDDGIPYTSHNSAACIVADAPDESLLKEIIDLAAAHVVEKSVEGSDPGVCVAFEGTTGLDSLIDFGHECVRRKVTQKEALKAASSVHLSGHGGTNDGVIGAAAAVGLTASGWCGRFIEFDNLRSHPGRMRVSDLNRHNIQVASIDRDASVPAPADWVRTNDWVRPWLLGNHAVLLVQPAENGSWENIYWKRSHSKPVNGKTLNR